LARDGQRQSSTGGTSNCRNSTQMKWELNLQGRAGEVVFWRRGNSNGNLFGGTILVGASCPLASPASSVASPRRIQTEFFDADRIGKRKLFYVIGAAGDRFQPIGFENRRRNCRICSPTQKFSRECRARDVDFGQRRRGGEIFWVEGFADF